MVSVKQYQSKGFSLIELVMIIILMAILLVVAIPTLINISAGAQTTTTTYIASSLSAANAENYVSRILNSTNGVRITNCTSAATLLKRGLPPGYSITSLRARPNTTVKCTLKGPVSTTSTFLVTGIR